MEIFDKQYQDYIKHELDTWFGARKMIKRIIINYIDTKTTIEVKRKDK